MVKRQGILFWLILFILILLFGLSGLIRINAQFSDQEQIIFFDTAGDRLHGTYLPGSQPVGVILLEGFGSDQIALRPAASIFRQAGAHIFSFDFSGHGRSPGALGFDNAATERLAFQVIAAKQKFKQLSGLDDDQILYFGHSLGARAGLQAATLDENPPNTLILMGTQVNLSTNLQSEFFTGTSDAELDWVQGLSAQTPGSNVLLLSGSWDDILTPEAAIQLYEKLTAGGTASESGPWRQLSILPAIFHNYEIYSARLFKAMASSLEERNILAFPEHISLSLHYLYGACTLIGLIGALLTAPVWIKKNRPIHPSSPIDIKITGFSKFFRWKGLLWLAALPVAAILTSLFFLLPMGLPVLNLIYVGFIGGNGILMLTLYRLGKMPGTRGKLQIKKESVHQATPDKNFKPWVSLGLWGLVLLSSVIFTRAGLFFLIPPNQRLAWLGIFSPITAIGFWIGAQESQIISAFRQETGRQLPWADTGLSLIGLTPFFVYTLFMGVLGSLSGLVGSLQGLLILWIVLLTGSLLRHLIRRYWLIALLQSVLLYALILPQNVLFAF